MVVLRRAGAGQRNGGDGGESNSPSRNLLRRPLRACPMICRRSPGRPSAVCRAIQSRPLSGFDSGYATLLGIAPPLNDASTAHGGEAASTLTLLPKQRGREQTGCCQLLRLGSFLRGLESNLGSRSPVTGPCRNHASPRNPRHAECRRDRRKRILRVPGRKSQIRLSRPRRALPMLSGRGPNLPLRVPLPVGSRARRCRACDRAAACLDPGLSRAWPGCVR